ncbi:MAG TPA: hypothetical protein VGI82_06135, partial [Chitinophagaceae bacterium]
TMTKQQRTKMYDENNTPKDNKTGIMGLISRDGKVRTQVIVGNKSFKELVRDNVSKNATLVTDSYSKLIMLTFIF